jgi:DNA ligase-1
MATIKPMLASPADMSKVVFPVYVSPKLDGIRGLQRGVVMSRSFKPIPNAFVQSELGGKALFGLDGELIVGSPTDHDCIRTTTSGVMSDDKTPDFTYYVFDNTSVPETTPFDARLASLHNYPSHPRIKIVPHTLVANMDDLDEYEAQMLTMGYEGIMLRDPKGPYKYGRATVNQGWLLKVKRFTDAEMVITDVEEEMHNDNEAKKNALGRTERSTHQANMVGKGTMGTLVGTDIATGADMRIGTGFDAQQRKDFWFARKALIGKIAKYKYFEHGTMDRPRHPVFIALRDQRDM